MNRSLRECPFCNFRIPDSNSSPASEARVGHFARGGVSGRIFAPPRAGVSIAQVRYHPRTMRTKAILVFAAVILTIPLAASNFILPRSSPPVAAAPAIHRPQRAGRHCSGAPARGFAAMQAFRPGYPFWRHVFTIPDGSIAFGSAIDGRLLATFPARGDWSRHAVWTDPTIAPHLDGQSLALQTRRATGAGCASHRTRRRTGAAQPDARRCAPHERGEIRSLPRRVGRHLRAVRRARGHRPGPGHLRIGPERHEALERQCRRLLPVATNELETTDPPLGVPDAGTEPDDAGALLRRVLVGPRHEVRIVHPRALRAQRRRHERRTHADHRRASRWSGRARPISSAARSSRATCERCRTRTTNRFTAAMASALSLRGNGVRQQVQRQPA